MTTFILLAPLAGALIAGFGHRLIGERMAMIAPTAIVFVCAALSWITFFTYDAHHGAETTTLFRFLDSGTLGADWSVRLDTLTKIMLVVVTSVSSLVHLYSIGYMEEDPSKPRFFAYLSFFTFAMLALVTSDNLVQMFFGWEGVGVASYLLIGFWFKKPSANAAAMKAFIVNRVGDFGFALGIFGIYYMVDSIAFDDVFAAAPTLAESSIAFLWREWNAAELLAFLLFIGAMGKSAQLFLHTWLPDAMEGPTPVSALIHAATMVTAGVFLVCRMSPLYEHAPGALTFVAVIGASTAFFAATVGLVQNDIKRVIAYSTCSQLGYMFAAAGVGFYQAAMFHLFTHAFFKALLFLGAGSVIHAMHHEQDMRRYGGLRAKIPVTFWMMMLGTLAITGVGIPFSYDLVGLPIGFAGFVSKDAIIEGAYAGHSGYAFWLLVIAAAMTSFYSWRLMFMTFYGKPRDKKRFEHAHESPRVMLIPLYVLGAGAVLAGMVWYGDFIGHHAEEFFGAAIGMAEHNHILHDVHEVPAWVKLAPFVAMLLGLGVAIWFYILNPSLPGRLAESQRGLYLFLLNKWYFDEIYDFLFVRPAMRLGRFLWKKGDGAAIDGVVNGVALGIVPALARLAGRLQSGYVYHYAFAMLIGVSLLITWISVTGVAGGAH
ncbi:NADH-quinone oxidoreductase subunit L [Oceanicella actignis]|uniref:NADH-quinone oxidoreductase subunit L n=1 Tax=Oceanicella actignis TaxID=1189325 RepID=A0A1M7S004_9RHOB|nr:NADH-quinone oxidoreductase subunit L [Oceanicella actignis]TYO90070.1 NADH-quinone oxidoreductase subunit L [Oceanicella actignis]SES94352.1 NADH dehydrogenase subunit L [Oceanicella actignis]SHN51766.1 NADH-quinone oxidoreductase subunit L [Oceanicella actignis]